MKPKIKKMNQKTRFKIQSQKTRSWDKEHLWPGKYSSHLSMPRSFSWSCIESYVWKKGSEKTISWANK